MKNDELFHEIDWVDIIHNYEKRSTCRSDGSCSVVQGATRQNYQLCAIKHNTICGEMDRDKTSVANHVAQTSVFMQLVNCRHMLKGLRPII